MKKKQQVTTVVVGSLNTDLIIPGLKHFAQPGQLVIGKRLVIGPGGKSRNIASMIAAVSDRGAVAMVGKTVRDRFGLWKPPYESLVKAGVNVSGVKVLRPSKNVDMPGIVLIPVHESGQNELYMVSGANDHFDEKDVQEAKPLFSQAAANNGALVLTMEQPFATAVAAVKQAKLLGLRVMIDPGGIEAGTKLADLLALGVDLLKPNELEAKILTGIAINDLQSAERAARALVRRGAKAVVITVGPDGAYAFDGIVCRHIPVPVRKGNDPGPFDATGCGDQTMAVMSVAFTKGLDLFKATALAVAAGDEQFRRIGIVPLNKADFKRLSARVS